jgi:hypothetical protein
VSDPLAEVIALLRQRASVIRSAHLEVISL